MVKQENERLSEIPGDRLRSFVRKYPEVFVRLHRSDFDSETDFLMTEPKKIRFIAWSLRECHYTIGDVKAIITESLTAQSGGKLNPRVRENATTNSVRILRQIADSAA
jgi:hypothetical protein